ncbi:hypothetical protein PENTCL1PPCAC_12517, partial [Pristionchus entomophagus]
QFPIFALPTELISHSISSLSMEDRLRVAGVNKKLNIMELESKYHVEKMMIEEVSAHEKVMCTFSDQRITFYEEKSYSSDCIRRISKNASIGYLTIVLTGSKKFHREIYNLIKEFDIGELNLGFERHQMLKEMMVDSFFLDLTKACKIIYLYDCEKITSEALYQVYQVIL